MLALCVGLAVFTVGCVDLRVLVLLIWWFGWWCLLRVICGWIVWLVVLLRCRLWVCLVVAYCGCLLFATCDVMLLVQLLCFGCFVLFCWL